MIIPGIRIDDIDLYKEYGILPESRSIGNPNKKKILEEVPFSNKLLDFSELYGEQTYEERPISYVLNLIGTQSKEESAYFLQTILTNLLMEKSQFKLYDDIFPGYYFLAEVREGTNFTPNVYAGKLQVDFTAYPFKIKEAREGSPYWDDYSILDVYQESSFKLRRTTFKPMSVGQTATVGAWSTHYDGGAGIGRHILGESYKITDIRNTSQGVGDKAYYLSGLNKRVIEQDVVEAQNGAQSIQLMNNGISSVIPKVTATGPVTIIRGNEVYNLFTGTTESDLFRLNKGNNKLLIASGTASDVDFIFHKELI